MRTLKRGASNAGARGSGPGRTRRGRSRTKVFMNGSRPKARWNACRGFTGSWQKWWGCRHGEKGRGEFGSKAQRPKAASQVVVFRSSSARSRQACLRYLGGIDGRLEGEPRVEVGNCIGATC